MTDKEKLLKLADWFDAHDAKRGIRDTAVQDDLRRIAADIEAKDAEIARLKAQINFKRKTCTNCKFYGKLTLGACDACNYYSKWETQQ